MKQFSRSWSTAVRTVALVAAVAVSSVQSADATTVGAFETDTSYSITGAINWGVLGTLEFVSGSTLIYNSDTKKLVINAELKQKNGSVVYDFDFHLGQVRNNNGRAEFAFNDGNYYTGMDRAGTLSPQSTVQILHKTIQADADMRVFAIGGPASIRFEGGQLVFQNWLKLWGDPLGFDVAADPRFYLHKITPPNNNGGNNGNNNGSEVPEPMTMSLLGIGLAGMAARRKKSV